MGNHKTFGNVLIFALDKNLYMIPDVKYILDEKSIVKIRVSIPQTRY